MELQLDQYEAEELNLLLIHALGDLSQEIAGTDNAMFRNGLRTRRETLRSIQHRLDRVEA
ncbi:MAG TPA: hypothetical protein VMU77_05795 [Acidimicrobiales bacterium]|nr:hypothetical protein [Acidimicrobiales bacterium]